MWRDSLYALIVEYLQACRVPVGIAELAHAPYDDGGQSE